MQKKISYLILSRQKLVFILVFAVFVLVKWISFNGFNGSDDLHYAMLASKVMSGSYNPFETNDIFAGRILLIYWQSLIYLLGGISAFTTAVGTSLAAFLSCYLLLFKLIDSINWKSTLIGASLFFFNPIIEAATTGIMPDIYILFLFTLLLVQVKEISTTPASVNDRYRGILCGVLAFISLFVKENAILFLPFFCISLFVLISRKAFRIAAVSVLTFSVLIILSGLIYTYFTGDFFFRVHQIQSSSYANASCNYDHHSLRSVASRLTFGVWKQFIFDGFYPVILAALLVIFRLTSERTYKLKNNHELLSFIIISLLALYFPFSFNTYEPLCSVSRHFIFLLPASIILVISFTEQLSINRKLSWLFVFSACIIFALCTLRMDLKWYLMIYFLLLLCYLSMAVLKNKQLYSLPVLIKPPLLLLFLLYPFFYGTKPWYKSLYQLHQQVPGKTFYVTDHDNMMYLKLMKRFDTGYQIFSLEEDPPKPYKTDYQTPDSTRFETGWLLVNRAHKSLHKVFFERIDSTVTTGLFSQKLTSGNITFYLVNDPVTLKKVTAIVQSAPKKWAK